MAEPAPEVGGRRAAADILVQVFARGGNLILGIVVTVLLVRGLGDAAYGQWTTLFAIVQLAVVFSELGLEPAVVSRAATDEEREGDWIGALAMLRLLLSIPASLISAIACLIIADSGEMELAGILLSATLLGSVPSVLRAFNQLRVRNDVTMIVLTVNSVGWLAAVVVLAARDAGLVAYAAAFLAVSLLSSGLQAVLSLRQMRHPMRPARDLWRPIIKAGLALGGAGILMSVGSRAPQIFVFELQGDVQAGLYGAASRLFEQAHFIPMAVMTTLLPIMSTAQRADPERARRVLETAIDYLVMVSLPGIPLAIVAGGPLLEFLFGVEFAAAAPALPVLLAAFVLVAVTYPLDNMVIVLGLQGRLIFIALTSVTLALTLNPVLINRMGFEGAAWAVLIVEAVVTVMTYRLVSSRLPFQVVTPRLIRIAIAAVITGLVLWGLDTISAPLFALVGVTAIGYPALLVALGAINVAELRALARRQPPPQLAD